jgi:predicted amino acid racemase
VIFGGGFYARAKVRSALVIPPGGGEGTIFGVESPPADNIDYYRTLAVPDTQGVVKVGDTAILAFRTQIFVTRSRVAVVAGLRNGRPQLAGVFDSQGRDLKIWAGS